MQNTKKNTALVWFKNNLRVHDNSALNAARANHENVVAVFYFEPSLFENDQFGFRKIEKYRAKFLIETVNDLKANLKQLKIPLLVYYESPPEHIKKLVDRYNIGHIYHQKEWTTEEATTISKVKNAIGNEVALHSFFDQFLIHPNDIGLSASQIPDVFTVFRKHIEKNCKPRLPLQFVDRLQTSVITDQTKTPTLSDLGYKEFDVHLNSAFPFNGGETTALQRLDHYFFLTKKLGYYKKTRNGLLGVDYSSKFSPWLANGSLSPRRIYQEVKKFEKNHFKNQSTYWLVFELFWRDYFKYISLKHGSKIFQKKGILNIDYQWHNSHELINNWALGRTQEPFVNANMLELKHTGWMSNRGRQNAASYFARTLELDWRIGAAYFESLLIDYDVHSNYGNWMYVAGVGNDPRNRKFNVALQASRYDAEGTFQRLWTQPTLFDA